MFAPQTIVIDNSMAELEPGERARLVRLCARWTGDRDAAEDLAQETLFEAWRQAHKLYDPRGRSAWLAAIARNVCMRWARKEGRELARRFHVPQPEDAPDSDLMDRLPDQFDLEVELERRDLVNLLDRALGLLPPATRELLTERFVEEAPVVQVAARHGISEGAVSMRLQRGKSLLRQLFTTQLREEAAAYGLVDPIAGQFEETRIWCPLCGSSRLIGRFTPDTRGLDLRCSNCTPAAGMFVASGGDAALFDGIQGYKAALSRLAHWANGYFQYGVAHQSVLCDGCGRMIPFETARVLDAPLPLLEHCVRISCPHCSWGTLSALFGFGLCLPEGQRFWRAHPRLHVGPEREIEVDGRSAVVMSFQSVPGPEHLDVVFDRETFRVLQIHGAPSG